MFGKTVKPIYRFIGDWNPIGVHVKPKDTRSQEEIVATINDMIAKSSELQKFSNEIKQVNPKYLGLVSDTLELATIREMLPTAINMNKVSSKSGKSLIHSLLETFPKASKENPEALEFAQEVINNTDSITSKYFLAELTGVIENSQLRSQFKAAKPLVKMIAEETLNGGYTMDYSKQKDFMTLVKTIVNPTSKVDKLELLPKFLDTVNSLPSNNAVYIDTFVSSNAPVKRISENIEILPEFANLMASRGKSFDVVDFVTNNVNLK